MSGYGSSRARCATALAHCSTASASVWGYALDVGCGGGDVMFELACRAGPGGSAVGMGIDEAKLELARRGAAAPGLENATFHTRDIPRQQLVEEL